MDDGGEEETDSDWDEDEYNPFEETEESVGT